MSGAFIVFEGIDGAGKTTVCRAVAEALSGRGLEPVVTAEPTHVGIGAYIRSGAAGEISQMTEALLFSADRNDHTEHIMEWVAGGHVVLCDRYFASTVAYQSAALDGDSTDRDMLIDINRQFIGKPDLTILLDIDPASGLDRAGARGEAASKFERPDFLAEVRSNYLRLAEEYGFRVVDASGEPEEVLERVMAAVSEVV